MGLFSRKKRRDQEPQQSFVGPVHSQQPVQRSSVASHASQPAVSASSATPSARGGAPSAPSSRFHNPFSSAASSKQQSPPPPTPIAKSPYREYREDGPSEWNDRASLDVAPSSAEWNVQPERARIMSEAAATNRGSTLSLPTAGRPSLEVNQRQRQMSTGATLLQAEDEQAKRSRWRIGRSAPKPRQNSSGSMLDSQGQGRDAGESSGFVVKSFRTVSRVYEDPIPQRSTTTAPDQEPLPPPPPPAPVVPPTTQFSRPSVDSQRRDLPHQQQHQVESLRPSIELELSETAPRGGQPRRPSLATLGMGRPSSQSCGGDRDGGSGTISAEAFRVASARSAISLASLDGANSPPLESSRPRFEPQRPQSRTSRRGSNYSDAGSSILIPPRPSFAIGRHSNGSGSSIDSRSSSTSNGPSGSPATPASTLPYDAPTPSSPPLGQSRLSFSSSSQALSPSSSVTGAIAPTRPAAHRMSSGDSELRLIAAYGDMISSSPPKNDDAPLFAEPSPVSTTANRSRASFSAESPQRPRSIVTNNTPQRSSMYERGPNFSVQPPTPQSRTEEPFTRPKRTSSLQPDSVGKALQAMGVGRAAAAKSGPIANQKGKAVATRGWTSDSSDEELERLSTSDEESDDEVPLAAIKSRSQTDLTLTAAGLRSRTSFETTRAARVDPAEVEVLADRTSRKPPFATAQQQQKRLSQASLGVSPLARRGSNRRSMSTLSFSTSMTISQAAASSNASTPTLPPSAQRVPYQNRSVSSPSAPTLPSFATTTSTAPSSATETTASSALPSPLLQSASRDRSSASSGSATTTSSFPHTPKDRSPAVSTLGLETRSTYGPANASGHGSKPSVKFDLATAMSTIGEPRSQRLSMLGAASQSTPNLLPGGSALGLAPPVPSPFASPRYPRESGPAAGAPTSQETSTTTAGTLNERLKARHRAEALKAIQIGRELNDPSGLVPDHEAQEALFGGDGSDENEPLANLPSRGSMLGSMGRGPAAPGSMMSGFGGAPGGLPGVGVGGQYSHLAIPPPGVDPYLYASLPPDQKMSLHQRSQQMMAMMQEAAVRAKAESVMGGGGGAGGSTIGGHGGGRPSGHGQSMSMGSYDAFAAASSMGMPYGYLPQQQQHHPMAMMQPQQHHMPPFAPPFAMSQHFFQPHYQHPQHFYGMPAYAGSAIGFSGGPAGGTRQPAPSAIGIPSKASGMSAAARRSGVPGQGRAASAIGTGYRT